MRENESEKENFDRKDGKWKSGKLMKMQCVHCNENMYVKENPLAIEDYDIIETAENGNKSEWKVWKWEWKW